jgi:hypothetical protein
MINVCNRNSAELTLAPWAAMKTKKFFHPVCFLTLRRAIATVAGGFDNVNKL